MTTTVQKPRTSPGSSDAEQAGHCPGCPRCDDSLAPLCPQYHEKYGGLHPVCKHCTFTVKEHPR